jgi:hypothetical protein
MGQVSIVGRRRSGSMQSRSPLVAAFGASDPVEDHWGSSGSVGTDATEWKRRHSSGRGRAREATERGKFPTNTGRLTAEQAADTVAVGKKSDSKVLSAVERLNREFAAILKTPEVVDQHNSMGFAITGGTPQQFHDFLKAELEKFARLIKETGIRIER